MQVAFRYDLDSSSRGKRKKAFSVSEYSDERVTPENNHETLFYARRK